MKIRFCMALLSISMVSWLGCSQPSASSSSSATSQSRSANSDADPASFRREDGRVDWRARVDAAAEKIGQAQSDRLWRDKETVLKHALEAAQLMPPEGKDFDLPELPDPAFETAGETEPPSIETAAQNDAAADQADTNSSGQPAADQAAPGPPPSSPTNASLADENPVSNKEVEALRRELAGIFESLEGRAGADRKKLNWRKDVILLD